MNLKRTNWTNEEVIKILEGCKIYIGEKKRSKAHLEYLERHNAGVEKAIIQFCDFKADPKESYSAMAYNTEDKMIYVISEQRLPQ
jgi:hypothetical protein